MDIHNDSAGGKGTKKLKAQVIKYRGVKMLFAKGKSGTRNRYALYIESDCVQSPDFPFKVSWKFQREKLK